MYQIIMQPGRKRGAISKDSITDFLHDINSGEEEVCNGMRGLKGHENLM